MGGVTVGRKFIQDLISKERGVAGAVGIGLAGQSEDADAGVISKGGKRIIEAFHGSPHKFDRFSMDAIGTGEGAQAYGHGLYFADSEDVARGYRDTLSEGPRRDALANRLTLPDEYKYENELFVNQLDQNKGDIGETLSDLRRYANSFKSDGDYQAFNRLDEFAKRIESKYPSGGKLELEDNYGALYRAHIDVDPDTLLDWDKPLSEQSEAVRDFARREVPSLDGFLASLRGQNPEAADLAERMILGPDSVRANSDEASKNWDDLMGMVGADPEGVDLNEIHDIADQMNSKFRAGGEFWNELSADKGPSEASQYLKDRGIPGIRYRDGNTRGKYTARTMYKGQPYSDPVNFPDEASARNWAKEKEEQGFEAIIDDGTYNYVMFDDKPISIQERGNASPEMLAATATGSAAATGLLDPVFDALELPWKGYLGATRMAGGLLAGEGFDEALDRGVRQVRQPVEETADELGGAATDATGRPEIGTLAYLMTLLGGPI